MSRAMAVSSASTRCSFIPPRASIGRLPLPLEVSDDDFVVDVLENRLVRTAAEVLLRVPRLPRTVRTRLMRIGALMEDVSILSEPRSVKAPQITRLNERYSAALALAELILHGTSLTPSAATWRPPRSPST
ncbi:MAG: 5-methylcytosine restriction system specificity protein McrC [Gaiellaceae bacterium]